MIWKCSRRQSNMRAGFTLVELMLVVVIIGILAAVALPRIAGKPEQAKLRATQAELESIASMLDNFHLDVGRYPTTAEGLDALRFRPPTLEEGTNWGGPYTRKPLRDAWNRDYVYRHPPESGIDFDLICTGPDGKEGTEDDIVAFAE